MVYRQDNRSKKHRGRFMILGIVLGIGLTIGGFYVYDNYKQFIIQNVSQASNIITAQVKKDNPISQNQPNVQDNSQSVQKTNSGYSPQYRIIQKTPSDPVMLENEIHTQINNIRSSAGLRSLSYNEQIVVVARVHSQDMAINNYFDHTSPDGKTMVNRIYDAKIPCGFYGENIEQTFSGDTAESIVNTWMSSSGHRENILSPYFDSEGIGVYQDGQILFITEDFC